MTVSNVPRSPSHRLFPMVAASLIVGFLLPIVLALGPAAGGGESRMTGAALLGWGIGWALITLLSTRFTDQPQRWALVPAGIFGVTGIALIAFAPRAQVMASDAIVAVVASVRAGTTLDGSTASDR